MQTHFLFDVLEGYKPFEQMVQESQKSGAVIAASGHGGARRRRTRPARWPRGRADHCFFCATANAAQRRRWRIFPRCWAGGVSLLPAREITFYQDVAASREVAYRRIEAMRKVLSGDARAIVARRTRCSIA